MAPVVFVGLVENPTVPNIYDREWVIVGFDSPQCKCVLDTPSMKLLG